jgi:predicted anti-sigma-YlaC factor YlaD
MSHPTPGELLELHFGELPRARSVAVAAHADGCPACRALRTEVEWLEGELAMGPFDGPPADGLERVLARIEGLRPARERTGRGLRAVAPCAGALLAGLVAASLGGAGAAVAFFAFGSVLTLSLAPVLILESQRRSS